VLYNSLNVYCKLYNISTQKCTIVQLYNNNFIIVLHCTVDTCSTIQLHLLTVKCTLFQIQSIFVHEMTIGFSSFFIYEIIFWFSPEKMLRRIYLVKVNCPAFKTVSLNYLLYRVSHQTCQLVNNLNVFCLYAILNIKDFSLFILLTKYGRLQLKLFTNCHVSWDTLYLTKFAMLLEKLTL